MWGDWEEEEEEEKGRGEGRMRRERKRRRIEEYSIRYNSNIRYNSII